VRRVEFNDLAAFRVFQCDDSDIGKLFLARIFNMDCNQVMTTIRLADRAALAPHGNAGIAARLEVRNQEHDGAPVQHVIDDVERLDGVSTDALRFMEENVSHDAQDVSATFLRQQISFDCDLCTESNQLLSLLRIRGKSKHAGDLRGQIAL